MNAMGRASRRKRANAVPIDLDRANLDFTPAEHKLSTRLSEVIRPFIANNDTVETLTVLITIGVIAWNLALLPAKERAEETARVLEEAHRSESTAIPASLLYDLIERKLRLFRDDRRFIADFKVEGKGSKLHIVVAAS
jgi:hypothetical protein